VRIDCFIGIELLTWNIQKTEKAQIEKSKTAADAQSAMLQEQRKKQKQKEKELASSSYTKGAGG